MTFQKKNHSPSMILDDSSEKTMAFSWLFHIFLYAFPGNPPTSTLTTTSTPPAAAVVPCAHAGHQRPATVPSGGQMEMDGSEGDYVIYIYISSYIFIYYTITHTYIYIFIYIHILCMCVYTICDNDSIP